MKNLPNLWGGVLLLAYFAQGLAVPSFAKERVAKIAGPRAVPLGQAAYHLMLGLLLSSSILVPLLWDPQLFNALGNAKNAPVMVLLHQLAGRLGPATPLAMGAIVVLFGLLLGWLGVWSARFKDGLLDQLGPIKYAIVMGLLLMMFGVVGKVVLRLAFGIKYLISFPAFNLNI